MDDKSIGVDIWDKNKEEAREHLLINKPVSCTLEEVDRILEGAREKQVRVMAIGGAGL